MEIESQTAIENTSPILRPMGFGELLDTTFSLYRTHFLRFLGITFVYFMTIVIGSSISFLNAPISRNEWLAIRISVLVVVFGISVVVVNGLMSATAEAYLDGNIRIGGVLKQGIRRFLPCFVGTLLYGLLAVIISTLVALPLGSFLSILRLSAFGIVLNFVLTLFAFLVWVFVVVYFATYWCFFAAAILVEGKSIRDAIRRGRELIRRMSLKIVGTMMAIFLLYLGISFILRLSFSLLFTLTGLINMAALEKKLGSLMFIQIPIIQERLSLSDIVLYLIHTSVDAITMPIWVIGVALLYFDQRIRKEGFDIEVMAKHQSE